MSGKGQRKRGAPLTLLPHPFSPAYAVLSPLTLLDGAMTATSALKRTSLYDVHKQLGAKLVPFAGWEMPVQYPTGILGGASRGAHRGGSLRRLPHG